MRGVALFGLLSVFAVGLAGCYPEYHPEDHGVGDATLHNAAEQIVNPAPNLTLVPPAMDGQRAADGYFRYQRDEVIPPVGVSTTTAPSAGMPAAPAPSNAGPGAAGTQ